MKTIYLLIKPSSLHVCSYFSPCHLNPLMKQAEREKRSEGGREHYFSHVMLFSAPPPSNPFPTELAGEKENFVKSNLMIMYPHQVKIPSIAPHYLHRDLRAFGIHSPPSSPAFCLTAYLPSCSLMSLSLVFAQASTWIDSTGAQLLFLADSNSFFKTQG